MTVTILLALALAVAIALALSLVLLFIDAIVIVFHIVAIIAIVVVVGAVNIFLVMSRILNFESVKVLSIIAFIAVNNRDGSGGKRIEDDLIFG